MIIFNSPSEVENLHPLVKQNLDRLARRIQVLSSPLNYCLLWSQHRGSAVAETIHQSKEVIKQTYHWLHQCNKDKAKLSDKEYMLKKLDEHIREIDFCLQSLNLALSIIQTSESSMPTNTSNVGISPSSLLTASNRITAMHNSGGDVAVCFGQLFQKSIVHKTGWQRVYRRSAMKIYRNGSRKSYELRIECNEYGGIESSDDDEHENELNESHPLTMQFDLQSSIYFSTLSSLILDLPHNPKCNQLHLQNVCKHDLIEDAFGWVQMLANQVQTQFIFVLKSGLDDWDKPLGGANEMSESSLGVGVGHENAYNKISGKKTSLIFIKEDEEEEKNGNHDEEHEVTVYAQNDSVNDEHVKIKEHNLTASIVSLDTAVQQTRRRTNLNDLLCPGGDYDESNVSPQIMAYMTRLAIYENDYTKPDAINHCNSSFKKYKHKQQQQENKQDDDVLHEHVQQSIVSIASSSISSDSSASASVSPSHSDIGSEYESIAHADHIKVFPSDHAIKQQQRIPAHLSASDEELHLFLRNPPDPPIPFYPSTVSFKTEENHRKKDTNDERGKGKQYFAAPNNKEKEVTVTYLNNHQQKKTKLKAKKKKMESVSKDDEYKKSDDVDGNLSLSISDENHLKFIKKECEQITMDPSKSMAAINDATKTSLLENVDVTVSQTLNNNENNLMGDEEEDLMHGNFANLSIDD